MYGSMKAYLSGASIPSAFVERRASNSETSKPFNIRRSAAAAATNVCARRSRLCLPHIYSHIYSRVPVEIRFTSAVPRGNYEKYRRQSERYHASHCRKQVGRGKKRYLPETGRAGAREKSIPLGEESERFHDGSRVVLRRIYAIRLRRTPARRTKWIRFR